LVNGALAEGIKGAVVNGGVLLEDGGQSPGEFPWYPYALGVPLALKYHGEEQS